MAWLTTALPVDRIGLHKHFRMISIHNDMRSHGYATEDAPHTRIPGIWKKLHQLYDLETLDTREIEFAFSDDPDPSDPEEAVTVPDFELPEDEFGEMMWQKRFHREASAAASSPAHMSIEDDKALYAPGIGLLKALPAKALPNSTRSQKAESVAEATPTPKNLKNTRASRTAAKAGKTPKAGGSTAKNRKTQSIVSESAGEDDEEGEDERESSAESEGESAPTTRRTNRAKPKPAPKRTRKR